MPIQFARLVFVAVLVFCALGARGQFPGGFPSGPPPGWNPSQMFHNFSQQAMMNNLMRNSLASWNLRQRRRPEQKWTLPGFDGAPSVRYDPAQIRWLDSVPAAEKRDPVEWLVVDPTSGQWQLVYQTCQQLPNPKFYQVVGVDIVTGTGTGVVRSATYRFPDSLKKQMNKSTVNLAAEPDGSIHIYVQYQKGILFNDIPSGGTYLYQYQLSASDTSVRSFRMPKVTYQTQLLGDTVRLFGREDDGWIWQEFVLGQPTSSTLLPSKQFGLDRLDSPFNQYEPLVQLESLAERGMLEAIRTRRILVEPTYSIAIEPTSRDTLAMYYVAYGQSAPQAIPLPAVVRGIGGTNNRYNAAADDSLLAVVGATDKEFALWVLNWRTGTVIGNWRMNEFANSFPGAVPFRQNVDKDVLAFPNDAKGFLALAVTKPPVVQLRKRGAQYFVSAGIRLGNHKWLAAHFELTPAGQLVALDNAPSDASEAATEPPVNTPTEPYVVFTDEAQADGSHRQTVFYQAGRWHVLETDEERKMLRFGVIPPEALVGQGK